MIGIHIWLVALTAYAIYSSITENRNIDKIERVFKAYDDNFSKVKKMFEKQERINNTVLSTLQAIRDVVNGKSKKDVDKGN